MGMEQQETGLTQKERTRNAMHRAAFIKKTRSRAAQKRIADHTEPSSTPSPFPAGTRIERLARNVSLSPAPSFAFCSCSFAPSPPHFLSRWIPQEETRPSPGTSMERDSASPVSNATPRIAQLTLDTGAVTSVYPYEDVTTLLDNATKGTTHSPLVVDTCTYDSAVG